MKTHRWKGVNMIGYSELIRHAIDRIVELVKQAIGKTVSRNVFPNVDGLFLNKKKIHFSDEM